MPILPDGNTARAALLAVAADMPATRKLTGFLSHKANQGCNRCYFQAEREPGRPGATGCMSYYTKGTCRNRSKEEVFQQAQEYKAATTKDIIIRGVASTYSKEAFPVFCIQAQQPTHCTLAANHNKYVQVYLHTV